MCEVCEFYAQAGKVEKEYPAFNEDGSRSIWGYYHLGDSAILAQHYPSIGQQVIEEIASLIRAPRLLEVAGLLQVVHDYLTESFSKIHGFGVKAACNPLSILYVSPRDNQTIERIFTTETEWLHKSMEKLSLRKPSVEGINRLLQKMFGLEVTFGCSCCVIAVAEKDVELLYKSRYYQEREFNGRTADSDVLTNSTSLYKVSSVADVPQQILELSADFHQREVQSYLYFAQAVQSVLDQNHVVPNLEKELSNVRKFILSHVRPSLSSNLEIQILS